MSKEFPDFEQHLTKSLESKKKLTVHTLQGDREKFRESFEHLLVQPIKDNGEYLPFVNNTEGQVSEVNEKSKYTDGLMNCTGIAVTGIEKNTGKKLSFISHSPSPDEFNVFQSYAAKRDQEEFGEKQDDSVKNFEHYESLLQNRMREISERCEPDSLSATIYGGNVPEEYEEGGMYAWRTAAQVAENIPVRQQKYDQSAESLQAVVTSCLGITAEVIEPVRFIPQNFLGTEIYLDTQRQDLYVRYADY